MQPQHMFPEASPLLPGLRFVLFPQTTLGLVEPNGYMLGLCALGLSFPVYETETTPDPVQWLGCSEECA